MDSLDVWLESARCWLDSIPIPKLVGDSPTLQFVGKLAYMTYSERKAILTFAHVLAAAIFPIYVGSHASLRCPPSAIESCKGADSASGEDEDNDGLETLESSTTQGLTPSDAILFPVVGACILTALYFLIKWFEDPSIISRVLGWYFSACGVFALGNLIGDTLNVGTSFIFPTFWSSGDQLYYVDQSLSEQVTKSPTIAESNGGAHIRRKFTGSYSPFPGNLSIVPLSEKAIARVWTIRGLFLGRWIFRGYVHGGVMNIKSNIRLNGVIGQLLAVIAVTVYNVNGKTWWLSNLMSFGLCYSTLQLLSPTTFWTGSLVLAGLFFYDIFMVFYTYVLVPNPLRPINPDCSHVVP
jgi:minor histocompatibility antigen H13